MGLAAVAAAHEDCVCAHTHTDWRERKEKWMEDEEEV